MFRFQILKARPSGGGRAGRHFPAAERNPRRRVEPAQVAEELGLSVAAYRIAKSRVLKALRQEAKELIDGGAFF